MKKKKRSNWCACVRACVCVCFKPQGWSGYCFGAASLFGLKFFSSSSSLFRALAT